MRLVLLGAGASVEAGVPAAIPMAQQIYEQLRKHGSTAKAIEIAIGGLRFQKSISNGEPYADIDVEDLYEVLRLLGDRHQTLLAPFVGSWTHEVSAAETADLGRAADRAVADLLLDVDNLIRSALRSHFPSSVRFDYFRRGLGDALAVTAGHDAGTFARAADAVLGVLSLLSWIKDREQVAYLVPLLRSAENDQLWIATLNYDNAIELAAELAGVELDLGLGEGRRAVSFADDARASLAKLHGSVNWKYDFGQDKWVIANQPLKDAALIFGSGNKLRIDGPFLDLLFEFRTRLATSIKLEVCGYSFRDPHINYLLLTWLYGDPSREVHVYDPKPSISQIEAGMRQSAKAQGVSLGAIAARFVLNAMTAREWLRQ